MEYTPVLNNAPDFSGRITQDTHIINVPDLLNAILTDFGLFLTQNLIDNLGGMNAPLNEFINSENVKNKALILNELIEFFGNQPVELVKDKYYPIRVKLADNAANAGDSATLGGRTFNQLSSNILSSVLTNLEANGLSADGVENSLKFNGNSFSETMTIIKNTVVAESIQAALIPGVPNALMFGGMLPTEFRDYVIDKFTSEGTDADTLEGKTYQQILASIKLISESSWDSSIFDGKTGQVWLNEIKSLKVQDTFKLEGHSYQEIRTSVTTEMTTKIENQVQAKVNNLLIDPNFLNLLNVDSIKFSGLTKAQWVTLINNSEVRLSKNSLKLGNKTFSQIKSNILLAINSDTTLQDNIKNLALSWDVSNSSTSDLAQMANDIPQALKDSIQSSTINSLNLSTSVAVNSAKYLSWKGNKYDIPDIKDYVLLSLQKEVQPEIVQVARNILNENGSPISIDRVITDLTNATESLIDDKLYNQNGLFSSLNALSKVEVIITRTLSRTPVRIGDDLTYTIKVKNISGSTLSNLYFQSKDSRIITQLNPNASNGVQRTGTAKFQVTLKEHGESFHNEEFAIQFNIGNTIYSTIQKYPQQ